MDRKYNFLVVVYTPVQIQQVVRKPRFFEFNCTVYFTLQRILAQVPMSSDTLCYALP